MDSDTQVGNMIATRVRRDRHLRVRIRASHDASRQR